MTSQSLLGIVQSGGFAMVPLLLCSLAVWGVIFERVWNYRRLSEGLRTFHLEALNAVLRKDLHALRVLCEENSRIPTARLVMVALDRLNSNDPRVKSRWIEALERKRQLTNHELRRNLWILGTIGSAAPFIGLFGTVVGILSSFQQMAKSGSGGFAVVAAGISEALVATAAGIVVAVIAVMAFNAFQTKWSSLVLTIRLHLEEISELLLNCVTEGADSVKGQEGKNGS